MKLTMKLTKAQLRMLRAAKKWKGSGGVPICGAQRVASANALVRRGLGGLSFGHGRHFFITEAGEAELTTHDVPT